MVMAQGFIPDVDGSVTGIERWIHLGPGFVVADPTHLPAGTGPSVLDRLKQLTGGFTDSPAFPFVVGIAPSAGIWAAVAISKQRGWFDRRSTAEKAVVIASAIGGTVASVVAAVRAAFDVAHSGFG